MAVAYTILEFLFQLGIGSGEVNARMALELGSEKLLDVSFVFDGWLVGESGNGDWNRWGRLTL
jgi:hypothetical protein